MLVRRMRGEAGVERGDVHLQLVERRGGLADDVAERADIGWPGGQRGPFPGSRAEDRLGLALRERGGGKRGGGGERGDHEVAASDTHDGLSQWPLAGRGAAM
jgi:hypothetical protein